MRRRAAEVCDTVQRSRGRGTAIASTAPHGRDPTDPTRTPIPELEGYHPGRPPWSAPRGRDLLAGVAVLSVLLAILVVVSREGAPSHPPHTGSALPPPHGGPAQARTGRGAATAPAAATPDWPDVPVTTSVAELGPALSRPVADGLAAARARIDRCVAVEQRRAPGALQERPAGAGATELVLRLSGRSGAIHVVGVEQRSPGASAVLADCARRHLDGDAFPAPDTVPGRRHRLLVSLR